MSIRAANASTEPAADAALLTRRSNRPKLYLVLAVGVCGVAVSVFWYWLLLVQEYRLIEARFTLDAQQRVAAVQHEFANALGTIHALTAFYDGSEAVERDEFHAFNEPLLRRHPVISALGWAPLKPSPLDDRNECFPIMFVEPLHGDDAMLGHDLASDPRCLDALTRARDTGQLAVVKAAVPGADIPGADDSQPPELLVFGPVYRRGMPVAELRQRRENLHGMIVGVVRIGDLVDRPMSVAEPVGIDLRLFDPSAPADAQLIHQRPSRMRRQPLTPIRRLPQQPDRWLSRTINFPVADRQWAAYYTPIDAYVASQRTWGPIGVLTIGLLLSALLVAHLIVLMTRAAKLELVNRTLQSEIAERRRVEEALRLDEFRLETLLRLSQMTDAPMQEITDFALEEAVRLTESEIGYLAFLNEDETVLTMHSWSKTAMRQCAVTDKPLVYPLETTGLWGEAVRQRKPVVTNDYLAPNPLKKGHPEGHVKMVRHMNVPVFEGERIVAVAGVGNKEQRYDESDVRQLTLLMQDMWRLIRRKQTEEELRSAHNALETRVQKRTAELAGANEELKREIADRKRAEEAIRNSQALHSSLVENLPVHVLRKDLDGRFTFANRSYCELLGKPPADVVGKTDFDFYPPQLAHKYRSEDQTVIETGNLFEDIEEQRNMGDGESRYVNVLKSAVCDADGKVVGVQVIFWDVTKRKRAEAALEQERYLLHALMDNLPHNIYFKDAESRFIRINKALADCFRLGEASEALGKTDFDHFTDEHARQAFADEQEIIRTGRPVLDKEEKETWIDGHTTWALSTKMPLYDDDGKIVGTFGISRDITEQKRAEEALRAAKEAAEAASRAKSAFLANVSHEIRTPMNAIIGMAELLLGTELTTQQREFLVTLQGSGEALIAVINDILDFSKIEAEKLALDHVAFDLRESLGDAVRLLAVRAYGKNLELACRVGPEVPNVLIGDCVRLRQIVVNLVSNAIKFTEAGEVVLDVRRELLLENEVLLHFAVTDTGIGVPQDKLDDIFEAFEQADSTTTRRFGGTGLGLPIASRLIRLMGGRIWVESELGRGSTFHFTARFATAPGAETDLEDMGTTVLIPTQFGGTGPLKILLAEDSLVNQKLAVALLEKQGHSVVVADNGKKAVAAWDSQHFDLVLMDVQMPEMDGLEATATIRAQERRRGGTRVPIIAMTAHALKDDRQRCLQAGMDEYVAKPIHASHLFGAIEGVLGVSPAPGSNEASPATMDATNENEAAEDAANAEGEEFDFSEALRAVKGDRRLLRILLEAILDEFPRLMAAVRQAVADGDAVALKLAAHTLKGSVRYFTTSRAFEHAYQLEVMGREGDMENVPAAFSALEKEIEWLMPFLSEYLQKHYTTDDS